MPEKYEVHGVAVSRVETLSSPEYDAVVVVLCDGSPVPHALHDFIHDAKQLDAGLEKCGSTSVLRMAAVSGSRLVLAATGPLAPYHDVRSVGEAMRAGVKRAAGCGASKVVVCVPSHPRWKHAPLVALLHALEALYVSLQIRESFPSRARQLQPLTALGVYAERITAPDTLVREAVALDIARGVSRDMGGADPERMTPLQCARYAVDTFAAAGAVRVRVEADTAVISREFPLLAAVSRAADATPHHKGCVIFLEYEPETYEETVMMVGKGVTYDTGGCDVKTGGGMAGMARDKCGAAAVLGFFKACELLRPRVKAVGALGVVRNSVGSLAYVADEVLRSRAAAPVLVGNTDAEGRLVMADLLALMRERAANEKCPHLYTVATLTGHAARTYGPYGAVMDAPVWDPAGDGVGPGGGTAARLAHAGFMLGDPLEVSTIRREDFAAHQGRGDEELLQAESRPSTAIDRGHQGPAAFLCLASGLYPPTGPAPPGPGPAYTHVDVAGSAGSPPHHPTASPLLAFAYMYNLISV